MPPAIEQKEQAVDDQRSLERERFIKEQRRKPSYLISLVFSVMKYSLKMAFFTIAVIPPALFYWFSLIASQYQLTSIKDILTHVALGLPVDSPVSSIDGIGIAIWVLLASLLTTIGWFIFSFKSPLHKSADNHMMRWDTPTPEEPRPIIEVPHKESTPSDDDALDQAPRAAAPSRCP
ncbi:hypothetical protein [Teredinibacter purpureus]|uniref:hypothetical protein n=1 Tax=Teredinibacter purpureus TaxID=2731756 RepID=UPI0005F7A45D|nr:hypothetical protein [Teredinibacter purpureus]